MVDKPRYIPNWACVFQDESYHKLLIYKQVLEENKIPSTLLSQKDSAYVLNYGPMSMVYLYVPDFYRDKAIEIIETSQSKKDEK